MEDGGAIQVHKFKKKTYFFMWQGCLDGLYIWKECIFMNRQGCLKLYPQITITKTSNRGKNIFFQFLPFLSSRKKNGDYIYNMAC